MSAFDPTDLARKAELVRRNAAPVLEAIAQAAQPVRLVAITKYVDAGWCSAAVDAGLTELGENRILEGLEKYEAVRATGRSFTAHLVGPIQSNKARQVPGGYDFVQALDRLKIAELLDARAGDLGLRLPVLLEVNIDQEPQKAGVAPGEAGVFAAQVAEFQHLIVRGLMCIPEWPAGEPDAEYERGARVSFQRMKRLFDALRSQRGGEFNTLSMGMSADYQWAIEDGATMVRVGRMLWEE